MNSAANAQKRPTFHQFKESFFEVRSQLKRLKRVLPSPSGDDYDRQLFETIWRHGEAYAAKHEKPHPGIDPIELPAIDLPHAFEHLGTERLEPERRYLSARRLQELIEAVDEVFGWMGQYDEGLIPNMGWKRLERYWRRVATTQGRSKKERLSGAHVRLIGQGLPRVYEGHFGSLPRSASSSGKDRNKRIYKPWVKFVCAVYEAAFQKRLLQATVEEYWKRMQHAGLKVKLPIGAEWQDQPD
jgi:hypothetical protein